MTFVDKTTETQGIIKLQALYSCVKIIILETQY